MDLLGRPAADARAAVQENFRQPDDGGLVDLDAGIAHRAYGDRQGDALQQRKVDVNVEPLRLEGGAGWHRIGSRVDNPPMAIAKAALNPGRRPALAISSR